MRAVRALLLAAIALVVACGRSVELDDGAGGGDAVGATGTGSKVSASSTGSSASSAQGGASSGPMSTTSGAPPASSGTSGSTSTGVVCSAFGDACTQCESASCADVWCGCVNEPECLSAFACWNACPPGDAACVEQCSVMHQAGLSAALLVSDCAATACNDDCGWGQDAPPCTECLYANCAEVTNACIVDSECIPLSECLNACPPASLQCQQQCYADHGAGVDPLQAVIDCSATACPNVCG